MSYSTVPVVLFACLRCFHTPQVEEPADRLATLLDITAVGKDVKVTPLDEILGAENVDLACSSLYALSVEANVLKQVGTTILLFQSSGGGKYAYIYIYIYIYIIMCVCTHTHTHTHIGLLILAASGHKR